MLFFIKGIMMQEITVKPVATKGELNQFIKFPWKIYKDNKHWVPPLLMEQKTLLNKQKNPFFKDASAEYFLAYRNGEIVGRIAAIRNEIHLKYHKDDAGQFGFFESINDQQVADALFDKAKAWMKENGLKYMRGPANPSSNDIYGMLIEGFEDSPRLLMPYNPQYYIKLCERYGMKKAKDLFAWKIVKDKIMASEKLKRGQEIVRQRYGLKISQLNMKNFQEDLEKFKYVYNKAWAPNWGFVPMTEEQIDAMAKDMKPLAEPSLVLFGEINDNLVGAALVMLDYNQIFKTMNGRLFPFNFIKLFTQKKKINFARILTLGVIPEYQKRGLDTVFYWEIVNRASALGVYLGEASWVLEDNEMMNRGLELMNANKYKTYRIWEIKI
jgi:GNAT superfamily N-acetyltransferase